VWRIIDVVMFNPVRLRAVVHTIAAVEKTAEKQVDFGTATVLTILGLDSAGQTVANTAAQ
jgi:hypothetical protein